MDNDDLQFERKKTEVLRKVAPYFRNPSRYSLPRLTLDECSLLLARNRLDMMSKMKICKIEKSALMKMRAEMERSGISSISDLVR